MHMLGLPLFQKKKAPGNSENSEGFPTESIALTAEKIEALRFNKAGVTVTCTFKESYWELQQKTFPAYFAISPFSLQGQSHNWIKISECRNQPGYSTEFKALSGSQASQKVS